MKYAAIKAKIHDILSEFETDINGKVIRFTEGENLLSGEPNQIHAYPFIYTIFDRVRPDDPAVDLKEKTYVSLHRVCFQTQDKQVSENQLDVLVDELPDWLDESFEELTVLEPDSGWVIVAGIQCRALDIPTEVTVTCDTF